MRGRGGNLRQRAIVTVSTAAIVMTMALPASAHVGDDHDIRALATGVAVGSTQVSVWTEGGPARVGPVPVIVSVSPGGDTASVSVMLVAAGDRRSVPLVDAPDLGEGVLRGTIDFPGFASYEVVVGLGDDAVRIPVAVVPGGLLIELLVWAAVVHGLLVARWLARRTRRVWRRPIPSPSVTS